MVARAPDAVWAQHRLQPEPQEGGGQKMCWVEGFWPGPRLRAKAGGADLGGSSLDVKWGLGGSSAKWPKTPLKMGGWVRSQAKAKAGGQDKMERRGGPMPGGKDYKGE